MRRAAQAAAGLLAAAGSAAAQDADITGRWCFQTEEYVSVSACNMRGELELTAEADEGAYSCTLQTEESCAALEENFRSRQACLARRDGQSLRIDSVVLSYEPNWGNYTPDNFSLEIHSGARMSGSLQSPENPQGPDNAAVTFIRCGELVS